MNAEHNHQLSELSARLTPENRHYLDEIATVIGSGSLAASKGEAVLLDLARQLLKAQERNRDAYALWGPDARAYAETLLADLEMRKPRTRLDKVKYYVMIPWMALTWVFFIYTIFAFLSKWSGSGSGTQTMNTATLLLIAAGSIVLIELVTRFMGAPDSEAEYKPSGPRPLRTEIKTLGFTILGAVLIVGLYILLQGVLPSFTMTAGDCLVAFAVGLAGHWYFLRKPRKG
jgi:hypothetical protein